MLSRVATRTKLAVGARRYASTDAQAKSALSQKLKLLPPEVAMKIVREGLRQKKEATGGASFGDWLINSGMLEKYRQWMGYRRYGLRQDDLIADLPAVHEAIVRLPKKVQEQRTNRLKQAFVLSAAQKQLDDDKWTHENEDVPDLYPYVLEVEREFEDRTAFRGKGAVF